MPPLEALRDLARRWMAVLLRPSVRTFHAQLPAARWEPVWGSVLAEAVVEAGALAVLLLGPGGAAGVSSLPFGPRLHLPPVSPLWLALGALAGSFAQFFAFSWLLALSARLFGGRGSFLAQSYLIALSWVPLMAISAVAELFGTAGSVVGLLARLYALYLLVPALASAHRLPLVRALGALLVPVAAGLLLGLVVLVLFGSQLSGLAK
jgi:hypothetical protein